MTAEAWRVEVGRFRASHPRRTFPLEVNVGTPAGDRVTLAVPWPVPATYDVGQRLDLALALVDRWPGGPEEGPPQGWVGRVGALEPHDEDHLWHGALARACGMHGTGLGGFRVVTKQGWLDLLTGETREWVRLRLTRGRPG